MFALSLNNKVQVLTLNLRTNAFLLFLSFEDIFTLSYQGKRLMISGKAESMILWLCLFPPEWTYFSEPKYHYSTSGRFGENILDDKTAFFFLTHVTLISFPICLRSNIFLRHYLSNKSPLYNTSRDLMSCFPKSET